MVKVALDFSAGIAQPAGIGRYVRELVRELGSLLRHDLVLWYGRPSGHCYGTPPATTTNRALPLSETWLTRLWHRLRFPLPVELVTGEVDLVHGPNFLVPPARAPRLVTIHDLSFLLVPELGHPRLVRFLSNTVPRMLREVDAIITVSEAVRQDLLRLYHIAPNRIFAIPHGVSSLFAPIPMEERRPVLASFGLRDPYVIAVGTIEPRKGYPVLIRAIELAATQLPDLQLVVVGSTGWLAERIEAALLEAERRGWLVRFRSIGDSTLATLYSGAAAFVTASYYEGFNLPLLEAMACAAPVIATDLPAHREVAGDAALFVPIDAPHELAEAILTVLMNGSLRERLSRAARERARSFTWRQSAEQHLEVYRQFARRS
uniref:Glycosyltransferase family 1 protein n=1 Tax=Thermomicrobium roseum TaxID=500 RepID=A0A7C5RTQ1_THERO